MDIHIIERGDFPKRLQEIPDPPEKLFIAGKLPPEDHVWLSVVGARAYTHYGKDVCEKFVAGLQGTPTVIVSGLAIGIDSIAHAAALQCNLKTVAVPGSGLSFEVLHPKSNKQLFERIVAEGGAVISEFEMDFKATHWSFPQRNRIMAALSKAVLVIEAEKKSGTLITAKLATEYNRDVLAVPGSVFSKNSQGPHMLIKIGATPITSPEELREALGFANNEVNENRYEQCSPEEKRVVELLREPLPRDVLIDQLGVTVSTANALISLMELKGIITESLGEVRLC